MTETWIGLFSRVNGGCRLRFTINKFPYQIQSWNYERRDSNFPILNQQDNNAAIDDLQSSIGIFSFLKFDFLAWVQQDLYIISGFYVYFYSNNSIVTDSTQNQKLFFTEQLQMDKIDIIDIIVALTLKGYLISYLQSYDFRIQRLGLISDELKTFKNLIDSRPDEIIKFLINLNSKSFNRIMISFKQIGTFYTINSIYEDPENSEEVYFVVSNFQVGKLNV